MQKIAIAGYGTVGGGVAVKSPSPSVRRIIQVAGLSRLIISGKNTEDKK